MTNLETRVLVSFIYFPTLLLSAFDSRAFALVMSICLGFSWHEYLSFREGYRADKNWRSHLLQIALGVLPVALAALFGVRVELGWAFLVMILQVVVALQFFDKKSFPGIKDALQFHLVGFLYLTGLFSLLVQVQQTPGGREAVWFLFFVVAVTDTAAYFTGRAMGKTPFFQYISPSKTLEGVWGGLAGALVVSIAYYFIFKSLHFLVPNVLSCIVLGLGLSLASIFGDLFESLIKRYYGVKDSGRIIPGHGGVMDRFDGILFAAAPLFFFVLLRGGFR